MSKPTALARLLDTPHLAQVVSRLTPEVLHQVILHHGLDACGALVAAATPQQVTAILDLDLWRPSAAGGPGGTVTFDAARFGAWLEALMEEGDVVAARVLAEMDEHLAVAGLSRYVRVFDPGVFEPTFSSDDDVEWHGPQPTDDCECEIGGYRIRARTPSSWDAVVGLLVTLDAEHPRAFHTLMRACRDLSYSAPEEGGLDDLLLAPEQAMHDVALEREQRRTGQGHISAEDARAFLALARKPRAESNPIAAAYFRDLNVAQPLRAAGSDEPPADDHAEAAVPDVDMAASLDAVAEVMAEAGITSQPRALLGPAASDSAAQLLPLEPLMEFVFASNPAAYEARNQELTFLANALMAGCSVYERPFTIQEAWDTAVGVCNLALDRGPLPGAFLVEHDLIAEFETGWRLLYEKVSLFVTDRLIATLAEIRTVDNETDEDLDRVRRDLQRERAAGTPWRAAATLDAIAILDTPAWACLCGLLSECPVVPDALGAILDGRTRAVSATAFVCFTTRAQVDRVREFGGRLRDLLA